MLTLEKLTKICKFSILCFDIAKSKIGECGVPLCSFDFLSKPVQPADCVMFCLNPCSEAHKDCLPHE